MSFDWKQESKERYFRMAEEKIEAAGKERVSGTQGMHTTSQFLRQERKADFPAWIFRDGDGGRRMIQRFLWMFKVKDCGIRCRKICLFCKYYRMCREEGI